MHGEHNGGKMNEHLTEVIERKLFMAERRYRIEQKNIWLYKSLLAQLGQKPKKKVIQMDMFSA